MTLPYTDDAEQIRNEIDADLWSEGLPKKGVLMSYSREEFEQAVTDRWSDSYSFTRFGDEDYFDEIVEGMWRGWQASRQALEGEPIGFLQSSGVSQLSGGHPAKLYPIGATPSPFESSTLVYTHPASRQAVSVPSILYDGYAVFQEVQHARNSKGLENIKDSALVSDVLDAVVKLIKQEQDDE